MEQELQEWEDARRALARRRSMTRGPLPRAPRPPPKQQQRPLQEVRAPPPPVRCRDTAVHNTFMCGDIKGVYAVLKDPAMVNALMETVHEEMVWAPEMGVQAMCILLSFHMTKSHSSCIKMLLYQFLCSP